MCDETQTLDSRFEPFSKEAEKLFEELRINLERARAQTKTVTWEIETVPGQDIDLPATTRKEFARTRQDMMQRRKRLFSGKTMPPRKSVEGTHSSINTHNQEPDIQKPNIQKPDIVEETAKRTERETSIAVSDVKGGMPETKDARSQVTVTELPSEVLHELLEVESMGDVDSSTVNLAPLKDSKTVSGAK